MKILALSDKVVDFIYSISAKSRFSDIDLILGCGDLPYYYLEFVFEILEVPLYFVRGNHASVVEYGASKERTAPGGGVDLHARVINQDGLLLAGFEGSVRYKRGPYMYTQSEMWTLVFSMVPKLLFNRLRYGRFLDVFVTHAPPWGIHDKPDHAHQGFKAFRWFIKTFRPRYHFHGHIHIYSQETDRETRFHHTRVINSYGYHTCTLAIPELPALPIN